MFMFFNNLNNHTTMKSVTYTKTAILALASLALGHCRIHHSALASGYHSLSRPVFAESYVGKFGKGFKLHFPTKRCPFGTSCSNAFHVVVYLIA